MTKGITTANIEYVDGRFDTLYGNFTENSYGLIYIPKGTSDRVIFPWHTLKKVTLRYSS